MNYAEEIYFNLFRHRILGDYGSTHKKFRKINIDVGWSMLHSYDSDMKEIVVDLQKVKVLNFEELMDYVQKNQTLTYTDIRNGLDSEDMWYKVTLLVADALSCYSICIDYTHKKDLLSYMHSLEYFKLKKPALNLISLANASVYKSSKLAYTNVGIISDDNFKDKNAMIGIVLANAMG